MTNRLYDLITRFVALSLVVAVVGVTTIALVAASAAESPHGAEGNGIFYDNVVLDALVAPDSAAVTLFGVAFLVIGLMRQRRAI